MTYTWKADRGNFASFSDIYWRFFGFSQWYNSFWSYGLFCLNSGPLHSPNHHQLYIDFTWLDAPQTFSPVLDSLFPHLRSLNIHIETIHHMPNDSRQSDLFQVVPDLLPLFLFFNLLYQPWANEITQPSSNTLSHLFSFFFSFLCLWWKRCSIKHVTG